MSIRNTIKRMSTRYNAPVDEFVQTFNAITEQETKFNQIEVNNKRKAKAKHTHRSKSHSEGHSDEELLNIMKAHKENALQKQSAILKELSALKLSWEICHFNDEGPKRTFLTWKLRSGSPSPFNAAIIQLYAFENKVNDSSTPRSPSAGRKGIASWATSSDERKFWGASTGTAHGSGRAVCPLELMFLDGTGKRLWRLPLVLIQSVSVFDEDGAPVQMEISLSGRKSSKPRIAAIQDSFDNQRLRYTSSSVELFFEKDAERDNFGALFSEIIRSVNTKEPEGGIEDLIRIEAWLTPRLVDGHVCIHKGSVKMKHGIRWVKKFLVLFRSKLVILETRSSEEPQLVLNLEDAIIKLRSGSEKAFSLRYPDKDEKYVFSTPNAEERSLWITAFEKRTSIEFGETILGSPTFLSTPSTGTPANLNRSSFEEDEKDDDTHLDPEPSQDGEIVTFSSAPPKATKTNTISKGGGTLRSFLMTLPKIDFSYDVVQYLEDPSKFYSDDLDAMVLKTQKNFFSYLRENLNPSKIPFSTKVPNLNEWIKTSKAASFTGRGRRMRVVDTYLEIYNEVFKQSTHIVKHAYFFCFDDVYHPGNSQISFSFPGFENQIFNVGQCALVSVWNCFEFANKVKSYSEEDWKGCLQSVSVAKELMQCSPDLTQFQSEDKKHIIRAVSNTAALEQLRSLILATHLAYNIDLIALEELDLFSFQDAKSYVSESANQVNLNIFVDTNYSFNPHTRIIQSYVSVGIYQRFEPDKVIGDIEKLKDSLIPYRPPNIDFDMIIATNMYWLKLFRVSLEERFKALQDLKAAIDWWKCNTDEKEKKRLSVMDSMSKSVKQEEKDLIDLLYLLPSEKSLNSPHLVSDVLLLQRKQIKEAFAREVEAQKKKAKLSDEDQTLIATVTKLREKTKTRKKLNTTNTMSRDGSRVTGKGESLGRIFSQPEKLEEKSIPLQQG